VLYLQGAGNRAGCHAFRRFRFALLRRAGVLDNLIKLCLGHSQNLMDLYAAQFFTGIPLFHLARATRFPFCRISNYCWKTGGAPLTHFHFTPTFTSTRLAILMKGMLLFMP